MTKKELNIENIWWGYKIKKSHKKMIVCDGFHSSSILEHDLSYIDFLTDNVCAVMENGD